MAAFGVNISLINIHKNALFTYDSPRGYQETHFLKALKVSRSDLEPKAQYCAKVYVWHTRTEKTKLIAEQGAKFASKQFQSDIERDAVL